MPPVMSSRARKLAAVLRPLGRAEAARAAKAAVEYLTPELVRDGISRFRVFGAELAVTRPKSGDGIPRRQVEVLVIDYLNRRHVRVVLEDARVVQVHALDHQPAVGAEEVAEATELAAAVPALRKVARQRSVVVSPYAPGGSPPGERRVGLRFVSTDREGRATILAAAEVDLNERRVLAVRLPGQGSTTPLEGGTGGPHGGVR
jgi:hypothetical protein